MRRTPLVFVVGALVSTAALAGCAATTPSTSSATPSAATGSRASADAHKVGGTKSVKVVALPVGNCGLLSGAQVAAAAGGASATTMASPALSTGGAVIDSCLYEVPESDRLVGVGEQVVRFRGRAKPHILSLGTLLPGSGSTDPGFEVPGLPEPVRTAVGSLAGTSTAVAETTVGPYLMWVSTTGQPSSGAAGTTVSTLLTALVSAARGH